MLVSLMVTVLIPTLLPTLALAADPPKFGSITFHEPAPGAQCAGDTEKYKVNIKFSDVNGWITYTDAKLRAGAVEQCENVWRVVPKKEKDPKDGSKMVDVVQEVGFEVMHDGEVVQCTLSGTLTGERADFFIAPSSSAGHFSKPCNQYGVTLSCDGKKCLQN